MSSSFHPIHHDAARHGPEPIVTTLHGRGHSGDSGPGECTNDTLIGASVDEEFITNLRQKAKGRHIARQA